jgi:hypothetical protein
VSNLVRIVAGGLLVAHGLVHLLYLVPNDDPSWPFRWDRSRLVPATARHPVVVVLVIATVLAFVLLALAVWGVPLLAAVWPWLVVVAAASSLLVLVAFWDAQLVWGVVIDVVLLVIAVWRPEWTGQIG